MTSTLADRTTDAWFVVSDLGHGIHVVAEPGHVNSFLVLGDDSALLFDTGMGIAPILPVIRRHTALPVLAVNSHHHYDHRGGNAELAARPADVLDIAVHPAGAARHDAASAQWRADYATVATRNEERFRRFAELDAETFFTLTDAQALRPVPDLSGWRIPAVRPTRTLADGEPIDLGGRVLRVLHTPGHSPDGLCLWDETSGSLLAGDTLLAAAFWAHFPESDIAVFADSIARLAELPVRQVLVAHNLRAVLPGSFPGRAAAAFAAVRDGRSTAVRSADPFGNPVWRHDFDGFAVFAPVRGSD